MGFLDKAKKLAEQAQTKLDEVQAQINQQDAPRPGDHVEYDQHGRPIRPSAADSPQHSATPPHGDPLAGPPASPPASPGPVPDDGTAVTHGDPLDGALGTPPASAGAAAPSPGAEEDRNHPSYAPPRLTSGDPLAG
jgi:hypothetical protein